MLIRFMPTVLPRIIQKMVSSDSLLWRESTLCPDGGNSFTNPFEDFEEAEPVLVIGSYFL